MKRSKVKDHHIGNLMLALVLLTALVGMYFLFKPTGRAVEIAADIDVTIPGSCCCSSQDTVFKLSAGVTADKLTPQICEQTCSESATNRHPVASLGAC